MRAASASEKGKKQILSYSHQEEVGLLSPNKTYFEIVSPINIRE
jgi:hypothetical protein